MSTNLPFSNSSTRIIRRIPSINTKPDLHPIPSNHSVVNIGSARSPNDDDSPFPPTPDGHQHSRTSHPTFPVVTKRPSQEDRNPANFIFVQNLEKNQFAIGDAVLCKNYVGILKYIHPKFIGLELVEANGNCDGSLIDPRTGEIVHCFHTRANHGIFVPVETIKRKISPLELLKKVAKQQTKLERSSEENRRIRRKYREIRERSRRRRPSESPRVSDPTSVKTPASGQSTSPSRTNPFPEPTVMSRSPNSHESPSSPASPSHRQRKGGKSLSTSFDWNSDVVMGSSSLSNVSFSSLFTASPNAEVPRRKKKVVRIRGSNSSSERNSRHLRPSVSDDFTAMSVSTDSPSYRRSRDSFSFEESTIETAPVVHRQLSAPIVSGADMKQAAPPPLSEFSSPQRNWSERRSRRSHRILPKETAPQKKPMYLSSRKRRSVPVGGWTDWDAAPSTFEKTPGLIPTGSYRIADGENRASDTV